MFTLIMAVIVFAATYVVGKLIMGDTGASEKEKANYLKISRIGGITLGIILIITSLITKVDGQEVGVVETPAGISETVLNPGWKFVAPWNTVHFMDKTDQVYTFSDKKNEGDGSGTGAIWVPTKDGIKMGFDVSVSWKIQEDKAWWIYANVSEMNGDRYTWIEENKVKALAKSAMGLVVSNYTPIEAYSGLRQKIQEEVEKKLSKDLHGYNLQLTKVDIREVFYNGEYEKAINNKKLAEQEVLRLVEVTRQQEEKLKQAEINKNIAIQQAEGEAKALQIKGSSISSNPRVVDLEWIAKWDGRLPSYMLGSGQSVMLNLNK